jgi:Na+-driven multidrug efflux pump
MAKSNILDMTEGNPTSLLLKFSIPMLIGNLFQQFYNMVDAMIVGNYVSANALGAVGATGSLNFLFFSLSFGLASGIGIMVSQYFGARDEQHVTKTIANSIYVLLSTAIIMSLCGALFARPILVGLNTPAVILEDAVLYMQVTCAGIVAISSYNGIAGYFKSAWRFQNTLIIFGGSLFY